MRTLKSGDVLYLTILVIGWSSITCELTFIREFISIFAGNELIFGVVLGNWLLLTGLGGFLGRIINRLRMDKIILLAFGQIFSAFILPFLFFAARGVIALLVPQGELVNPITVWVSTGIILLPFCIISGIEWVICCAAWQTDLNLSQERAIGNVYFIDTLGAIIGGLFFSYIAVCWLNSFQIANLIIIANCISAFLLLLQTQRFAWRTSPISLGRRYVGLLPFILLPIIMGIISLNWQVYTNQLQYKGQKVVIQKYSKYSNLVVTQWGEQLNFYSNGVLLFNTFDPQGCEETVHYALCQHPNPEKVLLIGGGISGTLNEIIKYHPVQIDYIELDPLLLKLGVEFLSESGIFINPHIKTYSIDARFFVTTANDNFYDICLIDTGEPETAQTNRFYTVEFFKEVARILRPDGIITLKLNGQENYMNERTARFNASIFNALKESFKEVIIIPGQTNFFIASNKKLTYDIATLIKEKNIHTLYVNEHYLKGRLTPERIKYVANAINIPAKKNSDFSPVGYYYYLLHWLEKFCIEMTYLIVSFMIIMILMVFFLKPVPLSIFVSGITGISCEIILVICFQILYGYIYSQIGILIAGFMFGIAFGSWYITRRLELWNRKNLVYILFLLTIFMFSLPLWLDGLGELSSGNINILATKIIFFGLISICGILVGANFPLATKFYHKGDMVHTAAFLYGVDLIGSFIGAFAVSSFLIPTLGVYNLCFYLGGLNLLATIILLLRRH